MSNPRNRPDHRMDAKAHWSLVTRARRDYAARYAADPSMCPVCCNDGTTNNEIYADLDRPASGWEGSGPWYTCRVCAPFDTDL
jgi:hypothetical protein